ncbi:MAG: helix-turn-helix domain-containing protein [Bacteroides sp.]|nr:helix-turn-helix domain-containing protein [Bacteroides sp.]MDE6230565.1 helix-turn-helix domain-containing protein [Muribaculaceae bacterium]
MIDLGTIIRGRRQELRLTQQALADMSGVSVRVIKQIETSGGNPSLRTIVKLLQSLGLQLKIG